MEDDGKREIGLAKAVSRLLLEPYGYRFDVYGGRVVVRAKSSGAIYGWDSLRDCLLGGSKERYAWYASVFDFLAGRPADGEDGRSPFPPGTRFGSYVELELALTASGYDV